jgi:hypothetical protein
MKDKNYYLCYFCEPEPESKESFDKIEICCKNLKLEIRFQEKFLQMKWTQPDLLKEMHSESQPTYLAIMRVCLFWVRHGVHSYFHSDYVNYFNNFYWIR